VCDIIGLLEMRLLCGSCWSMVFWSGLIGLWDIEHTVGLQPVLERTWLAEFWLSDALKGWLRWLLRGSLGRLSFNNHSECGRESNVKGSLVVGLDCPNWKVCLGLHCGGGTVELVSEENKIESLSPDSGIDPRVLYAGR